MWESSWELERKRWRYKEIEDGWENYKDLDISWISKEFKKEGRYSRKEKEELHKEEQFGFQEEEEEQKNLEFGRSKKEKNRFCNLGGLLLICTWL